MYIAAAWIFFLLSPSSSYWYLSIPLHLHSFVTCVGRTMRMEVALMTAVEYTFSALRWVRLERLRHPPF